MKYTFLKNPVLWIGFVLIGMMGASAQAQTLSLKEIATFEIKGINARALTVSDASVYLLMPDLLHLVRYDFETKKISEPVGGQGKGPGEFSNMIFSLTSIGSSVYVGTTDLWMHELDANLQFKRREASMKTIQSLAELSDGRKIVCSMAFENAAVGKPLFAMFLLDDDLKLHEPESGFEFTNTVDNLWLAQCGVAANKNHVFYTQNGERALYVYTHDGKFVKRVDLSGLEGEIEYVPGMDSHPMAEMLAKSGITDFRTARGGFISGVHAHPKYAIVQSGFASKFRLNAVVVVDVETATPHYLTMPRPCTRISMHGEFLYCLTNNTDQEVATIRKYAIE